MDGDQPRHFRPFHLEIVFNRHSGAPGAGEDCDLGLAQRQDLRIGPAAVGEDQGYLQYGIRLLDLGKAYLLQDFLDSHCGALRHW